LSVVRWQYRDEGRGKVLGEFDLRGAHHQTELEKRGLLVGVACG
jgi:hypothetical protein